MDIPAIIALPVAPQPAITMKTKPNCLPGGSASSKPTNAQSHHQLTATPTIPGFTRDECIAEEARQIRDELELKGEEYRQNPVYSPNPCEEEREEGRLAFEEFSGHSIFRFILKMISDEYSVDGIIAAGIPDWMIQMAARTALLALDFAILNKADPKREPKGKRSLAKSPRRSRRPVRHPKSRPAR